MELGGDVAVYFNGTLNEELSNDSESCAHEIWRRYNNRQQYSSESPPSEAKPRADTTERAPEPLALTASLGDFAEARRREKTIWNLTITPSRPSPTADGAIDLGPLSGEFSMIMFDKLSGCILAARDSSGAVPLFWGTSSFGECLQFSSDARLLEESCADADAFPTGTLFVSKCGEITGDLNMLVDEWGDGEETEEGGGVATIGNFAADARVSAESLHQRLRWHERWGALAVGVPSHPESTVARVGGGQHEQSRRGRSET